MLLTVKLVNTRGEEEQRSFEDVERYTFNENEITVFFNSRDKGLAMLPIRSNNGMGVEDWAIVEIKATRATLSFGGFGGS